MKTLDNVLEKFIGGDPEKLVNAGELSIVLKESFNILIWLLILIFIWTLIKDVMISLVRGFLFYRQKDFLEDDMIFVNGRRCRIHHIGPRKTSFIMKNEETGVITKLVLSNDVLRNQVMEKILSNNGN